MHPAAKSDVAKAIDPGAYPVFLRPSLVLRGKLTQFTLENALNSENDALAAIVVRYFRMAESEQWASWFGREDGS